MEVWNSAVCFRAAVVNMLLAENNWSKDDVEKGERVEKKMKALIEETGMKIHLKGKVVGISMRWAGHVQRLPKRAW